MKVESEASGGASRWRLVLVMLLLIFAQRPVPGLAWGGRGHQLIKALHNPECALQWGPPADLKFR